MFIHGAGNVGYNTVASRQTKAAASSSRHVSGQTLTLDPVNRRFRIHQPGRAPSHWWRILQSPAMATATFREHPVPSSAQTGSELQLVTTSASPRRNSQTPPAPAALTYTPAIPKPRQLPLGRNVIIVNNGRVGREQHHYTTTARLNVTPPQIQQSSTLTVEPFNLQRAPASNIFE